MQAEVNIKASFKATQDKNLVKDAQAQGKKAGQAFEKSAERQIKNVAKGLNVLDAAGSKLAGNLAGILSGGWIGAIGFAIGYVTKEITQFYEKIRLDKIRQFQQAIQRSGQAMKRDTQTANENKGAQGYFARLQELNNMENLNNMQKQQAIQLIKILTERYGDLGLSIDETTGEINGMGDAYERLFKQMTMKRGKSLGQALTKQANVILLNSAFQKLAPQFEKTNFKGWNDSNENKLQVLRLIQPDGKDIKQEDLKKLRQQLEKLLQLERKFKYFKSSGGFTSEDEFLGYFRNRNSQIENMKRNSTQQARNIAQNGRNSTMNTFVGNLTSAQAKATSNSLASTENAQTELAILQRIQKIRIAIQAAQSELNANRKNAEGEKDQNKRLQYLIKARANMETVFKLNKQLNDLQMQHNRTLQKGFSLENQSLRIEQQRKRQEFQRLKTTEQRIKWLQKEKQNAIAQYTQNANAELSGLNNIGQGILTGNNNVDKGVFSDLMTKFNNAFQAGDLQGIVTYGTQLKNLDFGRNTEMAAQLSASIDKVTNSMKQLTLTDQDYTHQIDQMKRQSKLTVYNSLLAQSESLMDRAANPNDRQYALQKRIRELQKANGGKPLDTSERAYASQLVNLEFALKEAKENSKVDFGEIKTNELTARGGFAGGAYVPETDFARITANNSQLQTALLRQLNNYAVSIKNDINQIP